MAANTRTDKACQKILIKAGKVSTDDSEKYLKEAQSNNIPFSDYIIQKGILEEMELLNLYAADTKSKIVDLKKLSVSQEVIDKVPVKFASYYKFVPIAAKERKLTIAVNSLLDVNTLDEIRFGLGFEVETVFARAADIEDMLKQHYGLGADMVDRILAKQTPSDNEQASILDEKVEDLDKQADDASVVQLVNQIILEAYKKRASDVHIEPYQGKVRLRYRIDGRLQEAKVPESIRQFISPIMSRIKVMANLNIVEKRLPQDGKARVKVQDQSINLRISSIPTPYGESMVIRILPTKMIFDLNYLGFEQENLQLFKSLIESPHGIIFVTGPTGSGKSTTLYAGISSINEMERKIITLEDPIEYELEGITQIQVLSDIGLTFSRGLRSVLRHDPDVMMVGEVRDFETADIAIRVALTGHLMLSTLHTNDAASGVTRLLDIGVEPFLVASSVLAFMGQRLVRVICNQCKEEDKSVLPEIREMIAADLGMNSVDEVTVSKAKGCERCQQTGFVGRSVIQEILPMTEDVKRLVIERSTADQIKKMGQKAGMKTMRQDGWLKVIKGITTPEEIIKATPADTIPVFKKRKSVHAVTDYVVLPGDEKKLGAGAKKEDVEKAYKERRKYVRVDVEVDVIFRAIDLDSKEPVEDPDTIDWAGNGESKNISAGGIAFHTPTKLYPGDVVEMKITLEDSQPAVECIGKILRSSRVASTGEGLEEYQRWRFHFSPFIVQTVSELKNYVKKK